MIYLILFIIFMIIGALYVAKDARDAIRIKREVRNMPKEQLNNDYQDERTPVPLRGIHPSQDSLWDTVDFYVRLGNACYDMSYESFHMIAEVQPYGGFKVEFYNIERAKELLPSIRNDYMCQSRSGTDKNGNKIFITLNNAKNILMSDAPKAMIIVNKTESGGMKMSAHWGEHY